MQGISKKKIERAVRELSPLSESARALIDLMNDPDHAVADVIEVVERDASLTIRILRIANSSVLSPPSPIESLQHAISLLGESVVVSAALAIGATWMNQPLSGYGADARLFEVGLKTAITARQVACRVGCRELAPVAYTAGLLHDVGKAVLAEFLEPGVSEVTQAVTSGRVEDWLAGERAELGIDHCQVGAQVADHFGLGPALRAAIEHHHVPSGADPTHRSLVEIVHVADVIRAMTGGDGSVDALSYRLDSAVLERFGMEPSDLSEIICETLTESGSLSSAISAG